MRRIVGKCVMNVDKKDVMEASCSLQLCAGQKSRNVATVMQRRLSLKQMKPTQ